MTKKHFFTASAIALSLALSSGTAYALDELDVDVNGNQLADNGAQNADDSSNVSTSGAIAEDSYNGGDTTTKTSTDTSTKSYSDSSTTTVTKDANNTDTDTKNLASFNTKTDTDTTTKTSTDDSYNTDSSTTTKTSTDDSYNTDSSTTTKTDTDTKNLASFNTLTNTKTDTDTKNDDSFNTTTKNDDSYNTDNSTTTKNDDSFNTDNSVSTKNVGSFNTKDSNNSDSSVTTTTKIIADQDLKGVIVNIGVKQVVDADETGVTTGNNSVAGSSFAAYAGILNAAWNTGVNSNAQAATNISAQGNVTFGSASAVPAAAPAAP